MQRHTGFDEKSPVWVEWLQNIAIVHGKVAFTHREKEGLDGRICGIQLHLRAGILADPVLSCFGDMPDLLKTMKEARAKVMGGMS